ncbi:MAG TPA: NADH:flavin oxidoreductase [Tepidisphaeraceae bacterium]|nr:NADH:flavin oxidoreductase [Tepidisphaeraceae bacterium]
MIGGMRLRNRIALPPLTTNFGNAAGEVTADVLAFYEERARDVGLVIVEATAVRPDGRITPYSLGLWRDEQIKGMKALAETIKRNGAAAVIQLNHAGARSVPIEGGILRASPSALPLSLGPRPTALSEGQIAEFVEDFVAAASRAAAAGFDGVEVHGAHYYLISEFVSPLCNQRGDRYGGDAVRRSTLAVEVVRAVRSRLDERCAVLFRLNAIEAIAGGQTLEESVVTAMQVKAAGVDALDISAIPEASWHEEKGERSLITRSMLARTAPPGANAVYAATIRSATSLPTIAVGKLGHSAVASDILARGDADVVAIGRQMIVDPAAAGKILAGQDEDIIRCKECLMCLTSVATGVNGVKCALHRRVIGGTNQAGGKTEPKAADH